MVAEIRVLFQHDDICTWDKCAFAFIRLYLIGNQAQQGRFPRAIAPDKRQPVARTNMQIYILKQPAGTLL